MAWWNSEELSEIMAYPRKSSRYTNVWRLFFVNQNLLKMKREKFAVERMQTLCSCAAHGGRQKDFVSLSFLNVLNGI